MIRTLGTEQYNDPFNLFQKMFVETFTTKFGLSESCLRMIPLLLPGLGIALAARMKLWNIGAEGQFHMGALGATGVVMFAPESWGMWSMLPIMAIVGAIMGALWIFLPAYARAYWGANEIITTLLLNYVAINITLFFIYGPWKDPGSLGFPVSPSFGGRATLPKLWGRVHIGFVVAILAAVAFYVLLWHTRWGYELRVIGESHKSANYTGINVEYQTILVLCLAGAMAGLAGMMEVSGVIGRLQRQISPGYGYTAIIIAFLAQLNPIPLAFVAFLFAGLQVGGFTAQISGVPVTFVNMIEGLILFCAVAGEFFIRYRLVFRSGPPDSDTSESTTIPTPVPGTEPTE